MPNGEMPEIEMTASADEPVTDSLATPVLLRRFVWDMLPCDETADLLTALGLTHGSDEGQALDHADSHQRIALVHPLESMLRDCSKILGVVVSTAMTEAAGVTDEVDTVAFAEQNAEVVLSTSRAMIANLMQAGILTWGPAAGISAFGGVQ